MAQIEQTQRLLQLSAQAPPASKSGTQAEEDQAARNLSLYGNPFGPRAVEPAEMEQALRELARTREQQAALAAPGGPTATDAAAAADDDDTECWWEEEAVECDFGDDLLGQEKEGGASREHKRPKIERAKGTGDRQEEEELRRALAASMGN
jgi:hypothetical protein